MARKQKKSSLPLVLVGLAVVVAAGVFGFNHFGGADLLTEFNQSVSHSGNSAKTSSATGQVTAPVGPTYDDPVPETLVIPEDILDMITTKTAQTDAVSVGGVDFGIETSNIVGGRADGSFELAGGRVVYPVADLEGWTLDSALDAAGYGSSSEDFNELKELTLYDQHDVILTATEEDGLQFDYDVPVKAVLALKENLVGSGRPVFRYSVGHRNVVQVGHATDRDGTRVIVYFPSDNIRAVDVTGHAQESIYWLVPRMLEPDYEAATAKLAERRAQEDEESRLSEEDDLAGKGDGAIEVTPPTEEERL